VNKDSSNQPNPAFTGKRAFYSQLKATLGFRPGNQKLYELAFVHKSASIKLTDGSLVNNERLEFLGDAILDAAISHYLFEMYDHQNEGFLTKIRSKIVNRDNLNTLAEKVGIDKLLIANVNQNMAGRNLYGNALEALIGAIYLDRGYNFTKKYLIRRVIQHHLDLKELEKTEIDFKSQVIEWAQKNKKEIRFFSSDHFDPENKMLHFSVKLFIDEQPVGSGEGFSKKEAEQHASEEALHKLESADF